MCASESAASRRDLKSTCAKSAVPSPRALNSCALNPPDLVNPRCRDAPCLSAHDHWARRRGAHLSWSDNTCLGGRHLGPGPSKNTLAPNQLFGNFSYLVPPARAVSEFLIRMVGPFWTPYRSAGCAARHKLL